MTGRSKRWRGAARWCAVGMAYTSLVLAAHGCFLAREGGKDTSCTTDEQCDDQLPCTNDFCGDDGFCAATAADNTIYLVQTPHDCRDLECQNGLVVEVPNDQDKPTTADDPCLAQAVCEGLELQTVPVDDGTECTVGGGTGECLGGECIIECDADNFLVVCNDGEDCTEDTCNISTGTCVNDPLPDQLHPVIAQVPGDCRVALCSGGFTVLDHIDDTDIPDDGNDCTDDVCNAGFPDNINRPEGTACGQGGDLVCNNNGVCVGCNTPSDCDGSDTTCRWRTCDNEQCGMQNANNGTSCNDNVFCNGADTCQNGSCSGHAGNPCDGPDGDSDCSEVCRETQDDCNGNDPNGSNCNDGQYCNGLDGCSSGSCSQHGGDPCNGPDGDSNCSESCREAQDDCNGADPNGSSYNDGTYCNGTDTCSGGSCSSHSGDPCAGNVGDNDSDCTESCDEGNNNCSDPDPNGSSCNDGVFCNGTDTCSGGSCSNHAGNPCPGHNTGPDCDDSCNEGSDNCTANDNNGTSCNDGAYCNGTDTCDSGSCSNHSGNPCPGHNTGPDCDDSCNEGSNNCTANDNNGTSCNDGAYCNGTDTCDSGSCSNHSGNPCNGPDNDDNCFESCDESNDNCSGYDGDGALCNGSPNLNTCCGGSSSGACIHESTPGTCS